MRENPNPPFLFVAAELAHLVANGQQQEITIPSKLNDADVKAGTRLRLRPLSHGPIGDDIHACVIRIVSDRRAVVGPWIPPDPNSP